MGGLYDALLDLLFLSLAGFWSSAVQRRRISHYRSLANLHGLGSLEQIMVKVDNNSAMYTARNKSAKQARRRKLPLYSRLRSCKENQAGQLRNSRTRTSPC